VIRKRLALIVAGALGAVFLAGAAAAIVVFQSGWFRDKVRERLITAAEDASGGRVEIGSFQFSWTNMRAEVRNLVLHGTEPTGKPPLARASSIVVGLKISSILDQKADVRYLNISNPDIHLIIDPDGHTNVPEPKVKRRSERTAMETLINLAAGEFSAQNGVFEIESQTKIPFDVRGNNLAARFTYERAGARYHGDISVQPLQLLWDGQTEAPLGIQASGVLERNRIEISSARVTTGQSEVQFSGAIEDLATPHANLRYQARVQASDLAKALRVRGLERGTVQLAGNAQWAGGTRYTITGNLHIAGGEFRQAPWDIQNLRADGTLNADPLSVRLAAWRFSGECVDDRTRIPVSGQVGELNLRGANLEARNIEFAALGGSFTGAAALVNWDRFVVRGNLHELQTRGAVSLYSREPLPWDGLVSGPVQVEGSLHQQKNLRLSANLAVAPAPQSAPVSGQVAVTYDQTTATLELGRSTLQLPASRVELTGAIGRRLRVHLETRDINDFLPLLGANLTSVPIQLQNGSAIFDGVVSGKLEDPQIAGHLSLTRFSYEGRAFDLLQADVNASKDNLLLQNTDLARGPGRAQFQLAVGLHGWKAGDGSSLAGNGSVRNVGVADVLALLGEKNPGLAGTVRATGQVAGTVGLPQWNADLEVAKGALRDEPFDRFTAHVADNGHAMEMPAGQLKAGAKELQVILSFDHAVNRFDTGRLRFQAKSNVLPLAEIRVLTQARPGLQGTLQIAASGTMDLSPAPGAGESFRLAELQADVTAHGLQLSGRTLGDAHLTAASEGSMLRARLETGFNGAAIRGDGEWRMEGDYPGNAAVTFTKLDLAGLREWISPSSSQAPSPVSGFAEGEIHLNGPALKPDLMQADVRIPSLEIRPVSSSSGLVLRNSGPIVAHVAKSEITIDKAELTGRSTDISIGGKVAITQRNPLDLRVHGRVDLALLQALNPDLTASGTLNLEAAVRGSPAAPQVSGRAELKDGAASYGMLPNGIINATGVILFTGDRATIQNLEGSTGGGKIQLSGFTGYAGGGLIFGLHARGQQVRIRYPEGISTVADANLDFTGSTDRSLVAGTVTIQRATANLQSDFGTLLAKSAQPVQTPSARSGFLAGLNFDITIQTAPDIVFESALTQNIQADANLRLRGTATNPALLGRINVTQGDLEFFGTKYTINQGSISFSNPVKIEPVLNVDLNTKARGIEITLSVTGPLSKPNVTPRSDPPLQFSEIVSLLTTGNAPISDVTRLGQQSPTAQSFQQSNVTALLGQVIANPVSGRLERFFGVSKLRINPTLDPALANGVQYNPQARLTIEQQVTPAVTFTYVTNLTNANPQVVSVEWSVSRQWSVVAQREENGLIGLDFYLKRRFK
jgi:translocation and assembly module TamB